MRKRSLCSNRTGLAVLELALVLPILMVLIFGLFQYGWLFLNLQEVNAAARRGVRLAAMPDATLSEVQNAALQALQDAGIPTESASVTVPTGVDVSTGDPVRVTVTVPFSSVELVNTVFVPVPDNLQASVSMLKVGP